MPAFARHQNPRDVLRERDELLLDDADDSLVPIGLPTSDAGIAENVNDTLSPGPAGVSLRAIAAVSPVALDELIAWAGSGEPTFGWRRAMFVASGINLGPSRRERRLRLLFCELYRHSHTQPLLDPER